MSYGRDLVVPDVCWGVGRSHEREGGMCSLHCSDMEIITVMGRGDVGWHRALV